MILSEKGVGELDMTDKQDEANTIHNFLGHPSMTEKILPYRIWLAGSFSLNNEASTRAFSVSRENINTLMENFSIELPITLDNLIPQSDTRSYIKLPIRCMQDFEPFNIACKVDVFSALLNCHQAIKNRLVDKISQDNLHEILSKYISDPIAGSVVRRVLQGVEESISEVKAQSHQADDEAIDRLFGMLDMGNQTADVRSEAEEKAASTSSSLSKAQRTLLQSCLNDLTRPLFKHLNNILHHDDFQLLEQSWRGLEFLFQSIKDEDAIEIAMINTEKQSLTSTCEEILSHTADDELPAVLLCDFAIDCTPADLNMLDELGQLAEACQFPALINVSNQFLAVHQASQLAGNSGLASLFSQAQYIKWNSLRKKSHSRWLTCCFNRFMLRETYTRHNNTALEFNEWLETDEYMLMGQGSWIVAKSIISSLQNNQWPTELTLPGALQLNTLPVHRVDISQQQSTQTPLEALIGDNLQQDLMNQGINVLQAKPDSDSAYFRQLAMLYKPDKYDNPVVNITQQVRNSLPHVLLSSRIALLISLQLDAYHAGQSMTQTQQGLIHYLQELLESTGENSTVDIVIQADKHHPGQQVAKIKTFMGKKIMNGTEVELQMPV